MTLALLTPGSYQSEICRAEQLRSLRKGKRVIPLLASRDADCPLHLEARQYRDFSDSASYQARFRELLNDIIRGVTAKRPVAFRQTKTSYITALSTVANYLERPKAIRALRECVVQLFHLEGERFGSEPGAFGSEANRFTSRAKRFSSRSKR